MVLAKHFLKWFEILDKYKHSHLKAGFFQDVPADGNLYFKFYHLSTIQREIGYCEKSSLQHIVCINKLKEIAESITYKCLRLAYLNVLQGENQCVLYVATTWESQWNYSLSCLAEIIVVDFLARLIIHDILLASLMIPDILLAALITPEIHVH